MTDLDALGFPRQIIPERASPHPPVEQLRPHLVARCTSTPDTVHRLWVGTHPAAQYTQPGDPLQGERFWMVVPEGWRPQWHRWGRPVLRGVCRAGRVTVVELGEGEQ